MQKRLAVALPIWVGVLSAVLMAWDIHNYRITVAMGMGFDAMAPIWPYHTAAILFFAINAPVYLLSNPISPIFHLYGLLEYVVRFPLAIGLWWFVGALIDHGLPNRKIRGRWVWFCLSAVLTVFLVLGGAYFLREYFRWWHMRTHIFAGTVAAALLFVADVAPTIWCFVFAAAGMATARRLATNSC